MGFEQGLEVLAIELVDELLLVDDLAREAMGKVQKLGLRSR